MMHYLISIIILAAAYLSMPVAAVAQGDKDCTDDTLWTRSLLQENAKACRFTPDGKYVLAAVGKTLCKYDALTGELVSRFNDTCDEVIFHVGWSNKCSKIATITTHENIVYIWDYDQEKIIQTIVVKNDTIKGASSVAFTNDDKYLLIGLLKVDQHNLMVYDMDSQQIIRNLSVEGGKKVISISPDDKYFVAGSLDYDETEKTFYSHLTLWKTENWEFVRELGYFRGEIISLNYSSDGKYLAFGRSSGNAEPILVWDMEKLVKVQEYPKSKTGQSHKKARFSPDSKFLVLSSGNTTFDLTTLTWDFINDTLVCKYIYPSGDFDLNPISNDLIISGMYRLILVKSSWNNTSVASEYDKGLQLEINYLNNFLKIDYYLNSSLFINLEIYDFSGKKITLYELGYLEAGSHTIKKPITLSSGVYFAVLKFGNQSISKQFEVVR